MKQKIQELLWMTAVTLSLYYLYRFIADEGFFKRVFVAPTYPLLRFSVDILVCLLLTCLSVIYSKIMMLLVYEHKNSLNRLGIHTITLFILDLFTAWIVSEIVNYICEKFFFETNLIVYFTNIFVFGLLATLMSSIKTYSLFWQQEIKMQQEHTIMQNKVDEIERVNTKTQLHNIQMQVNPHFFFNNLSVLSSLISTNPSAAKDFVNTLAMVYRHILKGMKKDIIPLEEELQLVSEYAKLLHIRHDKNLIINLPNITQIPQKAFVPPVSIQHLVENAVKHNAMTSSSPLIINIRCISNKVIVSNNKNKLIGVETHSGTGLANLQAQLKILGINDFEKRENDKEFIVSFPLIILK